MDVRMPDGSIIKNVPDGTSKADLVTKLRSNGMAVPAEWLGADTKPAATDEQRLLSSAPMRFAKGMKDPIDGGAQLLPKVLGAVTSGFGLVPNRVSEFFDSEAQRVGSDIQASEKEYQAAREASGQQGADVARFAGNVVSPANAGVARLVPLPAVGASVGRLAATGAAGGAAGAALQPVTGDDFWTEKALQTGAGAVGGAVLTPIVSKASESLARFVRDRLGNRSVRTPATIQQEIRASFARDDIDLSQIPQPVMDKLTVEVQQAMSKGQEIDAPALLRKLDFDRLGVKPLQGQLTRDPTQYARERDLRGIQGVGEPIANRLNEQAGQIAGRFRKATAGAQNPYEAGQSLVESLQSKDKAMSGEVRAAYDAFRESTGAELPVPLEPMKQGYKQTFADFKDVIPAAVRDKFDEILTGTKLPHSHGKPAAPAVPQTIVDEAGNVLADLTPKPTPKNLSIKEAEDLIKSINLHYDPKNKAQAKALDKLRNSVQESILATTDTGDGMEAGLLASIARDKASQRFKAIEASPALKAAAINNEGPDDFVRKYVIGGKVSELNKLGELVGPEGQKTMQQQLLRHLEQKAFGTNAAGDGAGSQAALNRELEAIGRNKLAAVLGPQTTDELYAIGRVMAYIQQQPAGSAVNNSNTGAAVANLFSKLSGSIKGAPYINDFVVKPVQSFRERGEVTNALSAALPKQASQLEPDTVNVLARLLRPVPVTSGAALGYSVR